MAQVRAAGLEAELELEGDVYDVPAGVELSAYRVVQEALTNTLRHAFARRVWVFVRRHEHELEAEVLDDGAGAPATASAGGRGLVGMRERVALFGGDLEARTPPRRRLPRPREVADVTIRVLLADDQALVRSGFQMILSAQPEIEVVGEAEDGRQAIDLANRLLPDVILMDVRMPTMDGLEATRRLVSIGTAARILILTTFDLDEYVFDAIRAGASGFLLKDVRLPQLVDAIRVIALAVKRSLRPRSRSGCSSGSQRRCPSPKSVRHRSRRSRNASATC